MGILTDILNALDRWPEWKRLRASPQRLDDLERRIAALEGRTLEPTADGERCPSCGRLTFFVAASRPSANPTLALVGARDHEWRCRSCEYTDLRTTPAIRR